MNSSIHTTLRTLSLLISPASDDGAWTLALARSPDPAEAFAPMAQALHVLLDWSAAVCSSDAAAVEMVDAGGAALVCKVLAEATLEVPPEQAGVVSGMEEVVVSALEHLRERCLSILTNLARFPNSSASLLSPSLAVVPLAVYSLHNEADPQVLQTTLRLIQTLVSMHSGNSLAQLVPLLSALLDQGSLAHLVFIATHTLNVRLYANTLALFGQLVWITHKRMALDQADTGDAAFPVLDRHIVSTLVAYVVGAMTGEAVDSEANNTKKSTLALDWSAATASVACLLTLAQIGPAWQALVSAHAPALYRLFALVWPSLVLDAMDDATASKWVRLVSQLPPDGWAQVASAFANKAREGDLRVQRALDKWGEVALVYQLPLRMVHAVGKDMSSEAVTRLVGEVPEAIEAVREAQGGQEVYEELMGKVVRGR